MELHWGRDCQIYVTPVGQEEVGLALISRNSRTRLDSALAEFPELATRIERAKYASKERGAITASRTLRRVFRGRTVLAGDASGGVDAIAGEGLGLAFRHAIVLAECLAAEDLDRYQVEHRKLIRRPALITRLMLLMGSHPRLRRRTMQVFESSPGSFARMLAILAGGGSARDHIARGIALGLQLLKA